MALSSIPVDLIFFVQMRLRSAIYTRVVILQQRGQLFRGRLDLNEPIPQSLLSGVLPEIPTQVFTCHPNTGLIAIKSIQVFKVGAHNITDFFQR
jgi:hypothetical protein